MAKKRKIKVWNEVITFIDEVIQNSEKLTRRSIEEKLHLSRGMISRWVKGNGSPTLDKILNILNVMDIEMTLEFKGDVETKILDSKLLESNAILDSKLLQQKMAKKLYKELEGSRAKLMAEILFSDDVSLEDKKRIHRMLNYLIVTEEMKKE